MENWFGKLTDWFLALVKSIFLAVVEVIHDAAVWLFDSVLTAIAQLLASLPVPAFLSGNSIGSMLSSLPPYALYVIAQMGLGAAFAILLSGVLFRLLRKLFTLGQW